jgi:putative Mg2+ transporter-C (MgtC) family protein
MPWSEFFIRFALAFVLSFLFGLERQRAHKPIGFGTFVFVATGACGIAFVAMLLTPANPLPLLGSIVTGIGFLGAGALIKSGEKIYGFTSAALIWIFAVFGMVIGVGYYVVGLMIYVLVWVVTLYDIYLEKHGVGAYQKNLTIRASRLVQRDEIEDQLSDIKRYRFVGTEVDRSTNRLSITFSIEAGKDIIEQLDARLTRNDWFVSYTIE